MTSAVLVRANGEVRHIDLPVTDAHIMVHHMVGGWFDIVRHPTQKDFHAYVHDEGLLLKQEPNVAISYLFGQVIVGDVVLSRSTVSGDETDFVIDDETVQIYKSCNTDAESKARLADLASKVDTRWTFTTE